MKAYTLPLGRVDTLMRTSRNGGGGEWFGVDTLPLDRVDTLMRKSKRRKVWRRHVAVRPRRCADKDVEGLRWRKVPCRHVA